jgi:hypothetical protein
VGLCLAVTVVEAGGMARTGLMIRMWRRLGLDANPMRRTADRIQAWTTLALLALLVTVGPVLAAYVGRGVYRGGAAVERTQRLERFHTEAVLTQDAPLIFASDAAMVAPKVLVQARWTGPDHSVQSGLISVDAGTRTGTSVMLWTDANGEPVAAPLRHDQVAGRAVVAGAIAMFAAAALVGTARLVLGRSLDRRRLAAWQAEWSIVGPAWTGRR